MAMGAGFVTFHRLASSPRLAEEPFVEIPYVAPLALYERISVTRMDVPVAALIAAGFEVEAAAAGASVSADVLSDKTGGRTPSG